MDHEEGVIWFRVDEKRNLTSPQDWYFGHWRNAIRLRSPNGTTGQVALVRVLVLLTWGLRFVHGSLRCINCGFV